ncbi:MAG: hypothetical protein HYX34_11885 [Actinobacteria bacterium]|nr:hypothetical protein [Actinomycetota bacterium]
MHLWWEPGAAGARWAGLGPPSEADQVSVVLTVVEPPVVPRLYFWALQASFVGAGGRDVAAAHLGLQWHPEHPGSTAVNWGGYRSAGGELDGTESALPSATGNPNTRDFAWRAGTPYRLVIRADGTGEVVDVATGATTVVRRLAVDAVGLASPVMWSEVFARCDDPPVAVRWSQPAPAPAALRVTYQPAADGGCTNTTARPDGDGVLQITNAARTVPRGSRIAIAS